MGLYGWHRHAILSSVAELLLFVGAALEIAVGASPSGSEQKIPALVVGAMTRYRTNPFNPKNPNKTSVSVACPSGS
jgi:hypothetical protein